MEQLSFYVYGKEINDELIPELLSRLNSFDIECSFLKRFSFAEHSGFLPFKFNFKNKTSSFLKDHMLVSGFDLIVNKSDINDDPAFNALNPEIRNILEQSTQMLLFKWDNVDVFEFRFAFLTSAIITELTGGVFYYPWKNMWSTKDNILELAWKEINNYEDSIPLKQLNFFEQRVTRHEKGEIPEFTRIIHLKENYFSFDYSY